MESAEVDTLTARQAAALLGAHVETVRRMARRGDIPSFKVGKDWRFSRSALRRWSESQLVRKAPRSSVLIVDDEESVCRSLSRIIDGMGYSATWTTDAREGLDMVRSSRPDLILLDLMMPVLNGPGFLARLRRIEPSLPVVIVTGFPEGELMRRAIQYAPLALLPKPAEKQLLERTLEMVLGRTGGAAPDHKCA